MDEINAKQELLEFLDKNNLEILEIDYHNNAMDWYLYYKDREAFPETLDYYKERAKVFKSIDDFDFNYDSYDNDIQGTIYCVDRNTQTPCWMTRWEDDESCGWAVRKIPEYFINHKLISYDKKINYTYYLA